jgi:protein-disulfide isomerase
MRFLVLACLFLLGASAATAQAPRAAAPVNWLATVAKTPEGGTRIGNPAARVKLVEYGSRTCPICGRFYAEGAAALKAYVAKGTVSWEFRDFPVHPQDVAVSTLGMCVSTPNFFKILDQMYVRQAEFNARAVAIPQARWDQLAKMPIAQANRALVDTLGYTAMLKQAGMTEARIAGCFNDAAALEAFGNRIKAASDRGVEGTPTFFLNGGLLSAFITWGQLEPVLKSAGA